MTTTVRPRSARVGESTFSLALCPRCEEGVLEIVETRHEVTVAGTAIPLSNVQAEQCPRCGYQALSGRETRIFEILFAPRYGSIPELTEALRAAGYHHLFLRQDEEERALGIGSDDYVAGLGEEMQDIYLDNESIHVLEGLDSTEGVIPVSAGGEVYSVQLPKLGEGENGVVFDYQESERAVLKLAKPRAYSRDHIRQECELTDFFVGQGIPVPAIHDHDAHGRFAVKERVAGVSLAVLYSDLGPPDQPRHQRARAAVRAFAEQLIELFVRHPEAKTSISPNNIFVLEEGERASCLLVDTGPAPTHDYSTFDFDHYWEVVVPEKIRRYKAVGYIE